MHVLSLQHAKHCGKVFVNIDSFDAHLSCGFKEILKNASV